MTPLSPKDPNQTQTLPPVGLDPERTLPPEAKPSEGEVSPPTLPGFEILSELGRGGMGVVYKARQRGLNRDVALKMVLSGTHASADEKARFLTEAEAIAAIHHPGIVQVYEFGNHGGQPYFALEYCPGGTLGNALAGKPWAARDSVLLVARLARAIQAAHDAGIIHRDLKPTNILLDAEGSPKIVDFGLARRTEVGSALTQTGAILGTPSYMAPEQAGGSPSRVGPRADVYALGAILYECVTGRPPFLAATVMDTVLQVLSNDPVPPSRLTAKLPRDLDTIALRCLHKDPARRYPTALALAEDLERFLTNKPILARPISVIERVLKAAYRHPGVAAALGLALVAFGAFLVYQHRQNILLERQSIAARQAEAEAETLRGRAQERLNKAVAAVEQVVMRVAGEKWAVRAELQTERREMLEEAIAFFNGLGSEESRDPGVRRQAARANLFAGWASLSLSDYERSEKAALAAGTHYRDLAEEFPQDSGLWRGQSETAVLRGHLAVLRGDFSRGLESYRTALHVAEKALALDPSLEDNRILVASGHSSLGLYHTTLNPSVSAQHHRQALAIGESLLSTTQPTFRARLVVATALEQLATAELSRRPNEASQMLDRANQQIEELDHMAPPSALQAETLLGTRGRIALVRGQLMIRAGQNEPGLSLIKKGVDALQRLVAIHPRSVSSRIQLVNVQIAYANSLCALGRTAEAGPIAEEIARHNADLVQNHPDSGWIKGLWAMARSNLLAVRLRSGPVREFTQEAEHLLSLARQDQRSGVAYNVACAYALAAQKGSQEERKRHEDRALALLRQIHEGSTYFRKQESVEHFEKDTDLDGLRSRKEFADLLSQVRAGLATPTKVPDRVP